MATPTKLLQSLQTTPNLTPLHHVVIVVVVVAAAAAVLAVLAVAKLSPSPNPSLSVLLKLITLPVVTLDAALDGG